MTPSKPTPGAELVEPLRQFLESFTQELTEQQFIPAFRGELGKLAEGLDNIQQSGETLQQIARGVERLRDVFAPAGTRMLESVRDLETQLRAGSDQLRGRADEVLSQLTATHRELEQALRTEAGLLVDQNSASREALSRLALDVDEQLRSFSTKLDGLLRKADQEIAQLSQVSTRIAERAATQQAQASEIAAQPAPAPVAYAPNPEELQSLLSRTESTVTDELARHSAELRDLLSSNTKDHSERLAKIDKTIDDALRTVAPRVQAELDSALARLRDQMDAIVRMERELPRAQEDHNPVAPAVLDTTAFVSALSGAENRILREFDEQRKAGTHDLAEIQQGLAHFALDLAEVTERQTERIEKEQQSVKELLLKLERMAKERGVVQSRIGKLTEDLNAQVEGLRAQASQNSAQLSHEVEQLGERLSAQTNQLGSQADKLGSLSEAEESRFAHVRGLLNRIDEQATKLLDLQAQETRATRERIESSIAELRSRWDGRLETIHQKSEELASRLNSELGAHLDGLKHDVEQRLHDLGEALRADLARFDTVVREQTKQQESQNHDLASEVSRVTGLIDERLSAFESRREENERFTRAVEGHVKVVATEVGALRSRQQEQLEVLKEAIRANYDDNAARLKEIIDGGYDRFLEQVRSIPQALDRYSKFVEAMNQSNQLALQGISGNTDNLLTIANDLKADNEAQKKFYPLLSKTLEKHGQMLEAVRRSQSDHDKGFASTGKSLQDTRDELTRFLIDLKGELRRVEGAEQARLSELQQMLTSTFAELEKLQRNDLPAFRREVIQLVQSKFDFIETTQAERLSALRAELDERLAAQATAAHKAFKTLALLIGAGVLLQVALHYNFFSFLMP